jgi:hypothetical protein
MRFEHVCSCTVHLCLYINTVNKSSLLTLFYLCLFFVFFKVTTILSNRFGQHLQEMLCNGTYGFILFLMTTNKYINA